MNHFEFAKAVSEMMAAQHKLLRYQRTQEAIIDGGRMPGLLKEVREREAFIVATIYEILYPHLMEEYRRSQPPPFIHSPGVHLSLVDDSIECPACGHKYPGEWYIEKLEKSKRGYIIKPCEECKARLRISDNLGFSYKAVTVTIIKPKQ